MIGMSVVNALTGLVRRIQSDCRFTSYELAYNAFLKAAGQSGFDMITLIDSLDRFRGGVSTKPCLALRHDVDINSVAGNQMFFRVERAHGATATYYFRLSTAKAHRVFIAQLLQAGFEVGYHFEEAATVAKRRRLKEREEVFRFRDEIQEQFKHNCEQFRQQYNPHMRSVSSHGDWINRHLKFSNRDLLDTQILAQCGLDLEAYDSNFRRCFELILSDVYQPPEIWLGENDWINRLKGVSGAVHVLTHERQWYPAPIIKNGENLKRLTESICYRVFTSRNSQ